MWPVKRLSGVRSNRHDSGTADGIRVSPSGRRHALVLSEAPAEVIQIAETNISGDVLYGHTGKGQKLGRLVDPGFCDVIGDGIAHLFIELAGEIGGTYLDSRCNLSQCQPVSQMEPDVGDSLLNQRRILVKTQLLYIAAVNADHLELNLPDFAQTVGVFDQHGKVGGDDIQVHRVDACRLHAFPKHGVQGKA